MKRVNKFDCEGDDDSCISTLNNRENEVNNKLTDNVIKHVENDVFAALSDVLSDTSHDESYRMGILRQVQSTHRCKATSVSCPRTTVLMQVLEAIQVTEFTKQIHDFNSCLINSRLIFNVILLRDV